MASGSYPQKYETGCKITGLGCDGQIADAVIYHAGTALSDDGYKTSGGRVLGVTATAASLEIALQKVYKAAETIRFNGAHYRKDIGKQAVK